MAIRKRTPYEEEDGKLEGRAAACGVPKRIQIMSNEGGDHEQDRQRFNGD